VVLAAAQLLKRVLFSVNPTDPATLFTMVAVLAIVATAVFIPARRAMKVDPWVALRNE
jgi:ABC-type lipoprotein release transport system permease subunit